jgi:small subunit ribosomal protein S27Ae
MSETKPKETKKKRPGLGALYEYSYEKRSITLKNKKCPRCGAIMAHHKAPVPRLTCGSCSYTDFLKEEK